MSLKLNAPGGGSVTLQEPTTASNRTLNLPDADGTALLQGTTLTRATAVAASGTAVDFTGIPSWAKRITVILSGVSTNGTSGLLVRIGDSGGVATTGYQGAISAIVSGAASGPTGSSVGYILGGASASNQAIGHLTITNLAGNTWVASGVMYFSEVQVNQFAGARTLSGTLDRVRITTGNGTDTFDAGTINIMWEG